MGTSIKRNIQSRTALIAKAREIASKSASFNTTRDAVSGVYTFEFFDLDKVGASQYFVAVFSGKGDAENILRLSLWECQIDTETGKGLFEFDFNAIEDLFEREDDFKGDWTLEFEEITLMSKKGNEYTHKCVFDRTPAEEEPAPAPAPRSRKSAAK